MEITKDIITKYYNDNIALIHYFINKKLHIPQNHPKYNDIYQIACFGFVKAITKYLEKNNNKYSIYLTAKRYIYGELQKEYNYLSSNYKSIDNAKYNKIEAPPIFDSELLDKIIDIIIKRYNPNMNKDEIFITLCSIYNKKYDVKTKEEKKNIRYLMELMLNTILSDKTFYRNYKKYNIRFKKVITGIKTEAEYK